MKFERKMVDSSVLIVFVNRIVFNINIMMKDQLFQKLGVEFKQDNDIIMDIYNCYIVIG